MRIQQTHIGRNISNATSALHSRSRISAALVTVILQFPAFFSCHIPYNDDNTAPGLSLKLNCRASAPEALNLFFFHDRAPMRLDSYQQISLPEQTSRIYGLSGSGGHLLQAISSKAGDTGQWAGIQYYGNLQTTLFSLADEDPSRPKLVGSTTLEAGRSRTGELDLSPVLCAVRIRSVACDFSERPYSGSSLSVSRLFLLHAGVEIRPLEPGCRPVSWINSGSLETEAVNRLPRPWMLLLENLGDVTERRISPGWTLYCYPNPSSGDVPGSPPTRLVIEATLLGHTCYYPISLPPMEMGTLCEMDITIRRMGTSDPDLPAVSGSVTLSHAILPWKEAEPQTVPFL